MARQRRFFTSFKISLILVVIVAGGWIFHKDIYSQAWAKVEQRYHLKELQAAADTAGLDPVFVMAIVYAESKFEPEAVSPSGARGLMQLMPSTAREVARENNIPFKDTADLMVPQTNLVLGSLYIKRLLKEFADTHLAIAAYNGGPNAVKQWLRRENPATGRMSRGASNTGLPVARDSVRVATSESTETDIERFEKEETRKYVQIVDRTYSRLKMLERFWRWLRQHD